MKNFISLAFTVLLLTIAVSAQALTIISDLDDTIKQTWVGNKRESIKNGLFSKTPFGGMAKLYTILGDELIVVSASTRMLRPVISNFLNDAGFKPRKLFLRKFLRENVDDFKKRTLGDLIIKSREQIVLVGDDVDTDPVIFLNLQTQFPEKIAAIYIRKVSGRKLPIGVIGFFHPLEMAAHEWHAQRLTDSQILIHAKDMSSEFATLPTLYYPKFVVCPQVGSLFNFNAALESDFPELKMHAQAAIENTIAYCEQRP